MKTIDIDDQIFDFLQTEARFAETSPNMVLRRLLDENRLLSSSDTVGTNAHNALPASHRGWSDRVSARTGDNSMKTPSNTVHDSPLRKKKLAARPAKLIKEGYLKNGETLYLHGYDGIRIRGPEFQATVEENHLRWGVDNRSYSPSKLAEILFKKKGHTANSVRGPKHWCNVSKVSISELWDRYLTRNS